MEDMLKSSLSSDDSIKKIGEAQDNILDCYNQNISLVDYRTKPLTSSETKKTWERERLLRRPAYLFKKTKEEIVSIKAEFVASIETRNTLDELSDKERERLLHRLSRLIILEGWFCDERVKLEKEVEKIYKGFWAWFFH